jgi:hypothetical protein
LVQSEQPAGIGFGPAAIKLSNLFRMKPQTVDGAAVSGAEVTIPLNFKIGDDPMPVAPVAIKPVDPKTMALARRLVIDSDSEGMLGNMSAAIEQIKAREYAAGSAEGASNQTLALGALADSFAQVPTAAIYAKAFTEEQMTSLVAYFESPVGKLWRSKTGEVAREFRESGAAVRVQRQAEDRARRNFCAKAQCIEAGRPVAQGAKP